MPLVAFILLTVLCLAILGFACACLSDQPLQAIDRALSAIPALPAVIQVWSLLALASAPLALFVLRAGCARSRSSPAVLQRFLL